MATVLAISSQVARGHVGLSAIGPALTRLGHRVIALPTVLLSNHPGHAHKAGVVVAPETLEAMLAALDANGWLGEVDAVLSGYLPSAAHVRVVAAALERVARARRGGEFQRASGDRAGHNKPFYICDPVLGDDPRGLYIEAGAAAAIRDELVARADTVKPNRFELAWLAGRDVATAADARAAAIALARPLVLATSIDGGGGHIANIAVAGDDAFTCRVARRARAPHGTGDLLTALFAGRVLAGLAVADALGRAVAGVDAVLALSEGADELALTAAGDAVATAAACAVERMGPVL